MLETTPNWNPASDIKEHSKMHGDNVMKRIAVYLKQPAALLGLVVLAAGFMLHNTAAAQGMTQVTIVGIPSTLPSPYTDQLEQNFRTGQYQVIFNYNTTASAPEMFEFNFVLSKDGAEQINITSEPVSLRPGTHIFTSFFDDIAFEEDVGDIIDQLDSKLRSQVVQAGTLPEGQYTIRIEARPVWQTGISYVQGMAVFNVRFPQPPVLVSPSDGSNVIQDMPSFVWTPVIGTEQAIFSYEMLLVELFQGQTPHQAIRSNRAYALTNVTGRTDIPYTPDFLPLEEGVNYAWQITAFDLSGVLPIRNEGRSEIYTFTYRKKTEPGTLDQIRQISELVLVPGFARLTGLDALEVSETMDTYVLNGQAVLIMDFEGQQPTEIRVSVQDLRLQKHSLNNPVLLGGTVKGTAPDLQYLKGQAASYVQLKEIQWRTGTGVTASAGIITPEDATVQASGNLTLQRSGISGTVTAKAGEGSFLALTGTKPLELGLTAITATFPDGNVTATARVLTIGEVSCEIPSMSLGEDTFTTYINCNLDETFYPAEDSDKLKITLQDFNGHVTGSWQDEGEFSYSASIRSSFGMLLDGEQGRYCGASGTLMLSDEDGIDMSNFRSDCVLPEPSLNLGFLNLAFRNPGLTALEYHAPDDWDFEFNFDAELFLPTAPNVKIPVIENITVTPAGIQFPQVTFDESILQPHMTVALDHLELALKNFSLENFVFPWFEWDGTGAGPWAFSFDAGMRLPDIPAYPEGLRNTSIDIFNAHISGEAVRGEVHMEGMTDCRWDFGAGYALEIHDIGGELAILFEDGALTPVADLDIDAEIFLGIPFVEEPPEIEKIRNHVSFTSTASGFTGGIENFAPAVPLEVGPYTADVTRSDLSFSYAAGGQAEAILSGSAVIDLGEDKSASGSFLLNLITGDFSDMQFELEGPFEWAIPKENSVLVFIVDSAVLTREGLFIDGRQSLQLGAETMGVTFDELLVDWRSFEVISGRIVLDEVFTFEAGIDEQTHELTYSASLSDTTLSLTPGVLMQLAGTVIIDSRGLHTSGSSSGALHFGEFAFENLEVVFTDDFAMGLSPFGVREGQADIFWDNQRIAMIDHSGFRPDFSFFGDEFLPDRIPLPTEEIAYLQIKQNEQLVVELNRLDDGTYEMQTKPGEPLKLVLPVLQGDQPHPPELDVSLSAFRLNPTTGNYIAGSVHADVPPDSPEFDLSGFGIPLTLNEIQYATQNINGSDFSALFLEGYLTLMEHDLGNEAGASLYIQSDGRVQGSVALPDLDTTIPLDPNSNMVEIHVSSVFGNVDIPMLPAGNPNFVFDLAGGFRINKFDGTPLGSAEMEARFNDQGFSVTRFEASALSEDAVLDLTYFSLKVDQISSLSMNYSPAAGFSYFADLDFTIGMKLPGWDLVEIPLKNVDIRNDIGIVIPPQDIHAGSLPGFAPRALDMGVFRLQPLAFRMERDTINIHDFSPGDLLALVPEMDFELSFPAFSDNAPAMAQQSLTLNSVGFSNGILSGSLLPYTPPRESVFLPLGPAGLHVDEISGGLYTTDENTQGFDVQLGGYFDMPEMFSGDDEACETSRVSFSLSSEGGFNGTIDDFLPCGELVLGPLSLGFGTSQLELAFADGAQSALLSGTASAVIEREGMSPVTASGALTFDLINMEIISGSIGISDSFTWHMPIEDPLFGFTVYSASIDSDGLTFSAGGTMNVGEGTISTNFNDFNLNLRDGSVSAGSVDILSAFAIDVSLYPTQWKISDPDAERDYEYGLRLVMPPDLTIDKDGLMVDGASWAALSFGDETYDALSLHFVEMAVGIRPVGVTSGRADLMLDDGDEPVRLAWFDADGFHADQLLRAVPFPDTLNLPSPDIAYIVLKNEQGQHLVQSRAVEGGVEIYTDQPVPLVIAAFADDPADVMQIDVSFSDVVINDAYEVTGGSISVDVSQTPLNLAQYDDFPVSITALHFQKLPDQPYRLYADARLTLPEALTDLEILVEQIMMGPGGFADATFSVGTYTTSHTEGDAPAVVSREFADGALAFAVRGVELTFGDNPSYKFSGDISSSFLTNADGDTTTIHVAADYSADNWAFSLDVDHITPQEMPIGQAWLILDALSPEFDGGDFNLVLDGRIVMSDLTGDEMEVGIEGLRIGTSGVSIANVNTDDLVPQSLTMFGQPDMLTITGLDIELTPANHLLIELSGNLNLFEGKDPFYFSDLKLGTDGTLELGAGSMALLGDPPVVLMGDYLVLNALQLNIQDGMVMLTASTQATLPDPLSASAPMHITVDHQGNVSVDGPAFVIENVYAGLGDLATFRLTGAGMKIDNIFHSQMTFFASAEIDINGNVIQFGQPGSSETWGIRYRMADQKLEWDITNTPDFQFETGFFALTISNTYLTNPADALFGVSLDANASFLLEGVGGAGLQLEGFEITTAGIGSMGNVTGGGFSFASAISVQVGSFDWGRNEQITVIRQDGDDKSNPGGSEESFYVNEFLRFASDNGSAVSISVEGGFSGEIEEIFYYRTSESLYLNIEGVDLKFSDHARLFASLEYEHQPNGFMMRVAGGGSFETAAGQSYGLAAMGRMSTLNNQFSFGIFVSVQADIPLFPGVVSLTEAGGGFFYNATNQDFEDVAALTDYDFYSETEPWVEKSGDYDFAVALVAGAGVVGVGGAYAVDGRTMILITDQWFAMDVQGTLLSQGSRLTAGMYLEAEWTPVLRIAGGVGARLDYASILSGEIAIDFFVIEDHQNSTDDEMAVHWAIHGDGYLDIIGGIATAEAAFMISTGGFYTEVKVAQGFDVWLISASSNWEGAIWWIYGGQFGAYVEIGFEATLFQVASIGGSLKGALIVDAGYLVYASANAYVSVRWVYTGDVTVWVSMQDGRFRGGRGSNSEYDELIAEARRQAGEMGDQMNEALAAAGALRDMPEVLMMSEEVLAAAGERLAGAPLFIQYMYFIFITSNELGMAEQPSIHRNIANLFLQGDRPPPASDYQLAALRTAMDQNFDQLMDVIQQVEGHLSQTYELALEWEERAGILLEGEVADPRQVVNMNWNQETNQPPLFRVDPDQAAHNRESLEDLKRAVDELDAYYMTAIDSVSSYISRIEMALADQVIDYTRALPRPGRTGQLRSLQATRPGANSVSRQYAKTTEAIDHFYGNYVSHRRSTHRWAGQQLSDFHNLRLGTGAASVREAVIRGNENMLTEAFENFVNLYGTNFSLAFNYIHEHRLDYWITQFPGNINPTSLRLAPGISYNLADYLPDQTVNKLIEVAAYRQFYVHSLDPGTTADEALTERQNFIDQMEGFASDDLQSLFINFVQKGIEFWYQMPRMGLEGVRDISLVQADSVSAIYREGIQELEAAHQAFTTTIDEIYKIKASLTMSLHGMVDIYAGRRADLAGEEAAADLLSMKEELEQLLMPPRITGIQVNKNLSGYSNKVTLSWNAQHESGNIVESGYYLAPGTVASVFVDGLLSAGDETDVTRYLFKEHSEEIVRNMRAVIRVRGPSGTAISRPATFSAAVDQYASYQGYAEADGVSQNIEAVDTTPPSTPVVSLDYNQTVRNRIHSAGARFHTWTERCYWTNLPDELRFVASSFDAESDIAAFEYALGSTRGATDIKDWTRTPGREVIQPDQVTYGGQNLTQEIIIRHLHLETAPHYLSVRAINGVDLVSEVREVADPIRFDAEPPSAPLITDEDIVMPPVDGLLHITQAATTSDQQFVDPSPMSVAEPMMTINWSGATDQLSGIHGYEYVITTDNDDEAAFMNLDDVVFTSDTRASFSEAPLSFTDEIYVFVRSVDNAGNRSQTAAQVGPIVALDPTRPSIPVIRARGKPDGIGFHLIRPSLDWETDVARYEFTAGTHHSAENLFPWTPLGTYEVRQELLRYKMFAMHGQSATSLAAPYLKIPLDNIPVNTRLYLRLRSVNHQGTVSGTGHSGWVAHDTTPPLNPSVSLSRTGDSMTIEVGNIRDPQSGISRVEYRVVDTSYHDDRLRSLTPRLANVVGWTDLFPIGHIQYGTLGGSQTVAIGDHDYQQLKVYVRVTNGNGMQTTVTRTPSFHYSPVNKDLFQLEQPLLLLR